MEPLALTNSGIFLPSPDLNQIVHHYEWHEIDEQIDTIALLPCFGDGCAFIFPPDQHPEIFVPGKGTRRFKRYVTLAPCLDSSFVSGINGAKIFRVVFPPGILFKLLGDNAFRNLRMKIGEEYPKMLLQPEPGHCIEIMENFLKGFTEINMVTLFEELIEICSREHAVLRSYYLASQLGISVRQLNRKLKKELGYSTREFLKLYRFTRVMQFICHDPDHITSLPQMAMRFGYYDQPHFSNEFRQMTGISPGRYIRAVRKLNLSGTQNDIAYSGLLISKK